MAHPSWGGHAGATSLQLLFECHVNATRNPRPGLGPDYAWVDVRALMSWRAQPLDDFQEGMAFGGLKTGSPFAPRAGELAATHLVVPAASSWHPPRARPQWHDAS